MARYRTYTIEFKRQLVEEHLSGGAGLSELARRHDISRELLRSWAGKHEAGELAGGRPTTPDRRAYEAKIAGLERKVGQLTMELDLLKALIGFRGGRPSGAEGHAERLSRGPPASLGAAHASPGEPALTDR